MLIAHRFHIISFAICTQSKQHKARHTHTHRRTPPTYEVWTPKCGIESSSQVRVLFDGAGGCVDGRWRMAHQIKRCVSIIIYAITLYCWLLKFTKRSRAERIGTQASAKRENTKGKYVFGLGSSGFVVAPPNTMFAEIIINIICRDENGMVHAP